MVAVDDGLVVAESVVVNIEYTLRVNGAVVDSTSFEGTEPIQFLQGFSEIIPGLEGALNGIDGLNISGINIREYTYHPGFRLS